MSGEKDFLVNVGRAVYNRIMNSWRRADNPEAGFVSRLSNMASSLNRELNHRVSVLNRRYDGVEKCFGNMSAEMRRIGQEQNRRMRDQAREFQQGMEALGREMADRRWEYTKLIREQGERLSRAMEEQRRAIQGQIDAVQEALMRREAGEREQARTWLQDAEAYLNMIDGEYRHEKFKPGVLERIRAEVALSKGNFENGNYQAAVASAQQTFLRASELRLELEQLELEWEAYLEAARRNAAEVLAACEAQEIARFTFETDEGAEEVAAEVDFWTEGKLSDLRKRVEAERIRLGAPDDLSLDDLKHSVAQSETWRQESLDLAEQAREALIASQLRNNIGQAVEQALADMNWEIVDTTYEGEDFRRAVHVRMQNLQGDELVTIITPEKGKANTITNKINVSFFDRSTNDEAFRQERLKTILGVFNEEGLESTPPVCRPGTEDKSAEDLSKLDLEKVRQMKTEQ